MHYQEHPYLKKLRDSIATVYSITNYKDIPLKKERFQQIKAETDRDSILQKLMLTISHGWTTEKTDLDPEIATYFSYRDELSLEDGVIF